MVLFLTSKCAIYSQIMLGVKRNNTMEENIMNNHNTGSPTEWSDDDLYANISLEEMAEASTDHSRDHVYTATKLLMETEDNVTSDENIPLASLRTKKSLFRKQRQVRKKIIEESESDDSLNDISYHPNNDSGSTTDSDESHVSNQARSARAPSKKLRKRKQRNSKAGTKDNILKKKDRVCNSETKQRKKKVNKGNILLEKLKKRIMLLRAKRQRSTNEIERAKCLSKKMLTVKTYIRHAHESRLDQLLASNELKRVPVRADGNCFFAAIAQCISDSDLSNVDTLRQSVCDLMMKDIEKYSQFLSVDSEGLDQAAKFTEEVELLRRSGSWNASIADCLPLVVAEKLKCTLRIYSSSLATPVIDIKPSEDMTESSMSGRIEIAYIAIRNEEHYDATASINKQSNNKNTNAEGDAEHQGNMPSTPQKTTENLKKNETQPVNLQSTPHKRADYQSPVKKLSSRKKKRNESNWKANIRKTLRCKGKQYVSKTGKTVKQKSVKPQNCSKCRFKCNTKFDEDERQKIFDMYYSLPNYERQRCFICDMVSKLTPVRGRTGKRMTSLKYFLAIGNKRDRVCKNFFLKTLDVGKKTITYTLKRKEHGAFCGTDKRGSHAPTTKTSEESTKIVREHINSFPRMESHYTRKNSKKQYLANDLNIKRMWLLYKELCKNKGTEPEKEGKYRQIFCEDFNLSFFKPKKDQCSLCAKYARHQLNNTVTDDLKHEYESHQEKKVQAREQKEQDKKRAQTDSKFYAATFDLQAVLTTPCCLVSELYYARKLCCYNLTIYSLGDKVVNCHLWDETNGKRGSCEIATCLMKNTQSVGSSGRIEDVTYYSDTCGGQNRNQFVAAAHLYTVSKLPQLKTLNHKFLQSGHSQMECDSVHSAIENAKKKTSVFVPSQWSTVVCMSRKQNPYISIPLKYNHVIDFKAFVKKHCLNLQTTSQGTKVNWLNVKWIQVRQNEPKALFVNYNFDVTNFMKINVQRDSSLRKRGRKLEWPTADSDMDLCYDSKLPISIHKKSDLVSLCTKGIIPDDFHGFFTSLKTTSKTKDIVPADSDDTDNE